MKTSFRNYSIVLGLVFILLCVGYWFLLGTIKEINLRANIERGSKKVQEERLNEELALKKLLSETEKSRTSLASSFVEKDEIAQFLSSLEDFASRWGTKLTVTSVSEAPASFDPAVTLLNLHVDVSGSFDRLLAFEIALQNMPTRAILSNVLMSLDGQKGGGTWRMSADLSIIERNHVSTP